MNVGKEVRAIHLTRKYSTSNNLLYAGLAIVALVGAVLMPFKVTIVPLAASAADDPLSRMMNDGDPAHAGQVQAMVKAVQSGADTDPVHVAQVNAFLAAQGQAQASQPAAVSQVSQSQPQSSAPAAAMPQTVQATQQAVQSAAQSGLYVDPNSSAANQARTWSNWAEGAQKMGVLASQPTAKWFGGWSGDVQSAVHSYVSAAASAGKIPMLVAYNIPQRDCGGYSAGGASNYTDWIGNFARGIGNTKAIVILEPDALAQMTCLSSQDQQHRYELLSGAVSILKSNANTQVYIDAGHGGWVDVSTMASRLQKANVSRADGFALNVSNFNTTSGESAYGAQISQQVGNKHFVIDTSRNGSGSINGQWCNPWGATIGNKPTTSTGNNLVDAYLWIKTPGESDGSCNGGPSAGTWWPDYAMSLVK